MNKQNEIENVQNVEIITLGIVSRSYGSIKETISYTLSKNAKIS